MKYPDALQVIDGELSLYLPIQDQVKHIYTQLKAKNSSTPFPFWAKIWPSAVALTAFLKAEPHWIEGKQVLELGAGIGVPSFSIANKVSQLVISDNDLEAIALIKKNIHYLNLQNVEAICLDWNHFPEHLKAETLLLSDINYAPDQFEALLSLIHQFLQQGTTIILSTPQRITVSPFIEILTPMIKRTVFQQIQHGQETIGIYLLILSAV